MSTLFFFWKVNWLIIGGVACSHNLSVNAAWAVCVGSMFYMGHGWSKRFKPIRPTRAQPERCDAVHRGGI
jgi:hypothetical protein